MKNLINKIKNLSKTAKAGLVGLSLATLVGTFGGNEGGLPPIYNKKVGTWGGINVRVYTEFQPNSKFYGLSHSFVNNSKNSSNFYGMQIGEVNIAEDLTGTQIGVGNIANSSLTGTQIGVANVAEDLTGTQIGVANVADDNWSLIFNYGNKTGDSKIK